EGVLGAVTVGAPVTVPAGVGISAGTRPGLTPGARDKCPVAWPPGSGTRRPERWVGHRWRCLPGAAAPTRGGRGRLLLMKHAAATGPVGWSLWVSLGRCWRGAEVVGEGRQISGLGRGQVGERRGGLAWDGGIPEGGPGEHGDRDVEGVVAER